MQTAVVLGNPKPKHELIDPDGLARVGEFVNVNDVLVNKESPIKKPNTTRGVGLQAPQQFTPMPERWKGSKNADGYVDSVMLSSNHDEHMIVKVSHETFSMDLLIQRQLRALCTQKA